MAAAIDINQSEKITEREFIDGIQMLAMKSRFLSGRDWKNKDLQSFCVFDWDDRTFTTSNYDSKNIAQFFRSYIKEMRMSMSVASLFDIKVNHELPSFKR